MLTLENIDRYRSLPTREKRWHLLASVCCAMIILGGCQLCHWFWVMTPKINYRSLAWSSLSPDTEVVIVGTSHVQTAVRPDVFSTKTMSISTDALDYVCMEALLKKALERASGVELVVLEMNYVPLLVDHLETIGDEQLTDWGGVSYRDMTLGPVAKVKAYLALLRRKRFTPARAWFEVVTPEEEASSRQHFAGYVSSDRTIDESRVGPEGRGRLDKRMTGNIAARQHALVRTIQMLEARQIQVRLLRLPVHESFWPGARPEWEQIVRRTRELVRERTGVGPEDVWDYSTVETLENGDFGDSHHLNDSGALKFSQILDRRIQARVRSRAEPVTDRLAP